MFSDVSSLRDNLCIFVLRAHSNNFIYSPLLNNSIKQISFFSSTWWVFISQIWPLWITLFIIFWRISLFSYLTDYSAFCKKRMAQFLFFLTLCSIFIMAVLKSLTALTLRRPFPNVFLLLLDFLFLLNGLIDFVLFLQVLIAFKNILRVDVELFSYNCGATIVDFLEKVPDLHVDASIVLVKLKTFLYLCFVAIFKHR